MGGGRRRAWWSLVVLIAPLVAACVQVAPPPPPPPPATRGSTFPTPPAPGAFTAIAPPPGAVPGGTNEWYRAPAPGGRAVVLGVYRPDVPATVPPASALVLHGNDGLRQQYERLAARLARSGVVGIVGCWFDRPEQLMSDAPDAISCARGPTFKGAWRGIPDLDALVAAARQVPDVDPTRLVLFGHSYGATVALDRATAGAIEPVVSTAGLLARAPQGVAPPTAGDVLPADPGMPELIDVPVMLAHGAADPIVPIGQAQALAALLTAEGNPPVTHFYGAPAGHSFPFTGAPAARFVADAIAWVATLFVTPASAPSAVPETPPTT